MAFVCDSCTFLNEELASSCEQCNAPLPARWACSACTFINAAGLTSCEMCSVARHSEVATAEAGPSGAGPSRTAEQPGSARAAPRQQAGTRPIGPHGYSLDECGCTLPEEDLRSRLEVAASASPGALLHSTYAALACPNAHCLRPLSTRDVTNLLGPVLASKLLSRIWQQLQTKSKGKPAGGAPTAAAARAAAAAASSSGAPSSSSAAAAIVVACPECSAMLVPRGALEKHEGFSLGSLRTALKVRALPRGGAYEEGSSRLLEHIGPGCQRFCPDCAYHEEPEEQEEEVEVEVEEGAGEQEREEGLMAGGHVAGPRERLRTAVGEAIASGLQCAAAVLRLKALLTGQPDGGDGAAEPALPAAAGTGPGGASASGRQTARYSGGGHGGRGRGRHSSSYEHPSWGGGSSAPKGTGYGGSAGPEFSAKAAGEAEKKQASVDRQLQALVTQLHGAVAGCRRNARLGVLAPPPALCAALLYGPLPHCLWLLLQNDSLRDVSKRQALYNAVFELLKLLASCTDLVQIFHMPTSTDAGSSAPVTAAAAEGGGSGSGSGSAPNLLDGLSRLSRQCEVFKRSVEQLGEGDDDDLAALAVALEVPTLYEQLRQAVEMWMGTDLGQGWKQAVLQLGKEAALQRGKQQERSGAAAAAATPLTGRKRGPAASSPQTRAAKQQRANGGGVSGGGGASPSDGGAAAQAQAQAQAQQRAIAAYKAALRPLQFVDAPLLSSGDFYFRKQAEGYQAAGGELMRKRLKHITEEISSLSTSLPLELDSSICLAVDEQRMDVLRALFFPSGDTPYGNGAFVFDILLPPEYPNKPPSVQFLTTGAGRVRFNPNLYNCGKVCLSLLGTWSGPSWQPGVSTLLQVLVSIQAMIFVQDPYFNEPGYDRSRGTKSGDMQSKSYNENLRASTLEVALLPALQGAAGNLPGYATFADAIRQHMWHKREAIASQCDTWLAEAGGQKPRLKAAADKIKALLQAMSEPPPPAAEGS